MRELQYASRRRGADQTAIGLFVPELGNPIFPALAEAIELHAAKHKLASILCNTAGSASNEIEYAQMLLARQVEGMVFIASEATDVRGEHDHYRRLADAGAKIVFVNGAVPTLDVASVGVDERSAGEIATRHLIELGHERIGFVAGSAFARPTIDKGVGRQTALAAAGIADDDLVAHGGWGVDGGCAAMSELLGRAAADRPTAVICSSDLMAIGALRAARDAGVRVPQDVAIVGFDGIAAAEWTQPPLTTLVQPVEDIARAAVDTLLGLFSDGHRVPHLLFRPRLVVRGSTAPA